MSRGQSSSTISGSTFVVYSDFVDLTLQGPATTVYQPPKSCLQTTTLISSGLAWMGVDTPIKMDCIPPTTAIDTQQGQFYNYSPGFCPSGWVTAVAAGIETVITHDASAWVLGPDTTRAVCCPSGLAIGGDFCALDLSSGAIITNLGVSISGSPTTSASSTRISEGILVGAYTIGVMWQSTDVEILALLAGSTLSSSSPTSASSSSSSKPISSTSSLASPGSSALPSPAPSPSSSGLSTGAKAGIAIGVILLAAIGAFVIFWLMRRRRKRPAAEGPADGPPDVAERFIPYELATKANTHELPVNPAFNKGYYAPPPPPAPVELPGPDPRASGPLVHELDYQSAPSGSWAYDPAPVAAPSSSHAPDSSTETALSAELAMLRTRIDQVRAEKERMIKLQELDELEAELQREILAVQGRMVRME